MVPGCGAGALSLLLRLILAEGQVLALWRIPWQLKQRTKRDTITIYMNVNLKNFQFNIENTQWRLRWFEIVFIFPRQVHKFFSKLCLVHRITMTFGTEIKETS